MKFAVAFSALAAAAIAQDVNTLEEISQNWDNIVSIINNDLPTLKAANPSIYAQATSVIGGTEITQDYNVELIQQVATGIDPVIMNAVLSRASVTGVTLDGNPIPTDEAPAEENSDSSESPVTSADESSSSSSSKDEENSASSPAESSDDSEESQDASEESQDSSEESESSDDSSDSEDSEDSEDTTSGANALVGKVLAAGVAAVAALF